MNKVNEATEWTEHRLEPLSGYQFVGKVQTAVASPVQVILVPQID